MSDTIAKLRELLLQQSKTGRLRGLLDSIYGAASTGAEAYGSASSPMSAEHSGLLGGLLMDMSPLGDVKSAYDGVQSAREGDWLGAGLGGLGALPMVPNLAGMFTGKGAKTWDAVNASKAMDMEKAGIDPRKIWAETGNWRGPDGHWRQEIPDNAATLIPPTERASFGRDLIRDKRLGHSLDHDPLYDTYHIEAMPAQARISANNGSNYTPPQYGEKIEAYGYNGADLKSNLLHEIQHSIQQREGFAKGGTPLVSERNNLDPFLSYWNNAGEAEARATQKRMMMDAAQRRNVFPADSYDAPLSDLIIRR